MLFRMLPIMPEPVVDFVLDHKIYRYFHLLPQQEFLLPIDLLVSIIKTDNSAFQYMHFYFLHIAKKFKRAIGLVEK
jgi:hypothetical protein